MWRCILHEKEGHRQWSCGNDLFLVNQKTFSSAVSKQLSCWSHQGQKWSLLILLLQSIFFLLYYLSSFAVLYSSYALYYFFAISFFLLITSCLTNMPTHRQKTQVVSPELFSHLTLSFRPHRDRLGLHYYSNSRYDLPILETLIYADRK